MERYSAARRLLLTSATTAEARDWAGVGTCLPPADTGWLVGSPHSPEALLRPLFDFGYFWEWFHKLTATVLPPKGGIVRQECESPSDVLPQIYGSRCSQQKPLCST